MTRALAAVALLALAAAAPAQERSAPRGYANPSAAVAAEMAFARLAQEKGQWTAFKATAAEDAVMFTPAMVQAHRWLNGRADPPVPIAWQAFRVWSSCDGSLMVTTGGWKGPDRKGTFSQGWFTTVWERQEKGGYKWSFVHRDVTSEALPEPEMISAQVADCPERRSRTAQPAKRARATTRPPFDPTRREGRSRDGTLVWQVSVDPAGTRAFTAQMLVEGQMEEIREERVAGA